MNLFGVFFELGWKHILEGYDHLLFLLGLVIITTNFRSLLGVVTAFTVAHSTTLILSAIDVIALDPLITESLIALSIVYVGVENIIRRDHNGRWIIAGVFGLVHGAGFSGHLIDLLKTTLDSGEIWTPLLGFNLGIEFGQLIVIIALSPLIWLMKSKNKQSVIVPEVSRIIAAVGAMLFISRIWGF